MVSVLAAVSPEEGKKRLQKQALLGCRAGTNLYTRGSPVIGRAFVAIVLPVWL